jgi:hypothetical protein
MATIDRIREAMHRQPFRPFGVTLVDGSLHTITNLEFVAIPPVERPREIICFEQTPEPGRYKTHWVNAAFILDVIVEGDPEPAIPGSAEDNGA